jgi:signal transduction histidine kinase
MVNACQAMEGTGDLNIEIRPDLDGRYLIVTLADNGCGISEEDLPKIFRPFFSTKGSGKGTGLGLAMVDRVMREHQGRIEVDSLPGQGARFDLYFPLEEETGDHDRID